MYWKRTMIIYDLVFRNFESWYIAFDDYIILIAKSSGRDNDHENQFTFALI